MNAPTDPIDGDAATGDVLGVVIVNFHSHRMVTECLASLDGDTDWIQVFVVDNSEDDDEFARLTIDATERGWNLLRSSSNVGFGSAANRGAREAISAGCSAILLLNPDMVITPEALRSLLRAVQQDPRSMVTPTITRSDGSTWFAGGQIDMDSGVTTTIPDPGLQTSDSWLTGACLAMSADVWSDVGGFDDDYFMYWEDIDLSYRAVASGYRLRVLDEVEVVHEVGGTQGRGEKSNLYVFHVCRNRLMFASRHVRGGRRLRWVLHTPAASWRIAMRTGRRSALSRPSYMFAALHGSVSGLMIVLRSILRRR